MNKTILNYSLTILITSVVQIGFCSAEYLNSLPKELKSVKKIHRKKPFEVHYVFGGPAVTQELVNSLNSELQFIEACQIEPIVRSVGDNCEPCNEVATFFQGASPKKIYSFNVQNHNNTCSSLYTIAYTDYASLEMSILADIIKNKKEPNDIFIYIPPRQNTLLEEKLKAGWLINQPLNREAYDTLSIPDCANNQILLYKEKPCLSIEKFELTWDWDHSGWEKETGYKQQSGYDLFHLFPPSFDSDSYYLCSNMVCGNFFTLIFTDLSGLEVARKQFEFGDISGSRNMNSQFFQFKLNQGNDIGAIEYQTIYRLVISIEDSKTNKQSVINLGAVDFVQCQKSHN